MSDLERARRLSVLVALAVSFGWPGARAEAAPDAMASAWSRSVNATMRLIAGGAVRQEDGKILAGLQLKLDKGWKTYWRSPGDSGVPPVFDWSASKNVGAARVLWPFPERVSDSTGTSNVYHDDVVFPIELTPKNPDRPIEFSVVAELGLCKDICVPSQTRLSLTIPSAAAMQGPFDSLLARALMRVPRTGGTELPVIEGVELDQSGAKPRLVFEVRYRPSAGGIDLFVEVGDESLPAPRLLDSAKEGRARLSIPLDAAEPARLKGQTLTVTLVSGLEAREVAWRLD